MASSHVDPFKYPKVRHARTAQPPSYKRYQSFKTHLRGEFRQKCVYCMRPDSVHPSDHKNFAVEHYRPRSRFPALECTYENLFYACTNCNTLKRDYWPAEARQPRIPNPCDHVMTDHVKFAGGEILVKSPDGAFTVELLQLNEPTVVDWRRSHTRTIHQVKHDLARLELFKGDLVQAGASATDIGSIEREIEASLRTLDRLCGTTL